MAVLTTSVPVLPWSLGEERTHQDIPLCRHARQVTGDAEDDVSGTKDNMTATATVAWTTNITHLYTSVTMQTTTSSSSTTSPHITVSWFQVVIPLVCVLGIIGNIFNIIVLTRRRMVSSLDRLGRSAYRGLVALALSDLLFCVTVLTMSVIPLVTSDSLVWLHVVMLYRLHGVSLINLLLMSSTWLVVMTAVTRYMAVIRPLQTRLGPCSKNTTTLITFIFLASTTLSLPYFLHTGVQQCLNQDNTVSLQYHHVFGSQSQTTHLLLVYIRWIWPVIADVIPLWILVFCNVTLARQLRTATLQRQHSCPGQHIRGTSKTITLTLVSIILMQLLLVTPSELLKYINPYSTWGWVGHVIAQTTNVMQTLNFACNFLMYLAVNVRFRKTVKAFIFEKWWYKKRRRRSHRRKGASHGTYKYESYVSMRRMDVKDKDVNTSDRVIEEIL